VIEPEPGRRGHWAATAVAALGAVAGVVLAVGTGLRRIVVEGDSMRPTLEPGDRLLLVPCRRPSVGDLVAVPDPRSGRLLVKRVRAVDGLSVEVVGDNPAASTDSRAFGPVPRRVLRGRVVRRYHPRGRSGPVR